MSGDIVERLDEAYESLCDIGGAWERDVVADAKVEVMRLRAAGDAMRADCDSWAVLHAQRMALIEAMQADITRLRAALGYISSPTMGLPGGADAATFCMDGATEQAARMALQCCIETARQALGGPS